MFLPWLTLPFLGKKTMKRFLPSGVFMGLLVFFESVSAIKRGWWAVFKKLYFKLYGLEPFIFGPFFIGSLWIMKLTYGRFISFIFTNLLIDTTFVYAILDWFKNRGYGTLIKLEKYQLSLLFFVKSILMYGFQGIYEKILR